MIRFLREADEKQPKILSNQSIILEHGWYEVEHDSRPFRWTSLKASIKIDPTKVKEIVFCYNGGPIIDKKRYLEFPIKKGFKRSFPIISSISTLQYAKLVVNNQQDTYQLTINEPVTFEENNNDSRTLGVKIYSIIVTDINNKEYSLPIDKFKNINDQDCANILISNTFTSNKLNISTIESKKNSDYKGILYFGQLGTCGYANAAKGNLYTFFKQNIPVSWYPLYFENIHTLDKTCEYNLIVESLINKEIIDIDTVILHFTPDIWYDYIYNFKLKRDGVKLIGFVAWESDKLPYDWIETMNNSVDEIWCPSEYNKSVYLNNGITVPIKVLPHAFLRKTLPEKTNVNLFSTSQNVLKNKKYTFYNISEYNYRKSIDELVHSFCATFTNKDNVRLILKLHHKDYSNKNIKHCIDSIERIIEQYNDAPEINLIVNRLNEDQILMLHSIGDCYISLTKSEGFGLTIFEAYHYGKQIITTGYGGHIEFLGIDHPGLVNYKIGEVQNMENFSDNYKSYQNWAYPDTKHAGELMKKYVNDYLKYNSFE